MTTELDYGVANVTNALKQAGMWANTVMVCPAVLLLLAGIDLFSAAGIYLARVHVSCVCYALLCYVLYIVSSNCPGVR